MPLLFVSFNGRIAGQWSQGWVVVSHDTPIVGGSDILNLCRTLENMRGYDPETLVLISFQRLEALLT